MKLDKAKLKDWYRRWTRPLITLAVICYVVYSLIHDHAQAVDWGHRFTLDCLSPSYYHITYLKGFLKDRTYIDTKRLTRFEKYYQKVAEYFPSRSDAYEMLGFFSYYLGKEKQAIASLEKAVEMAPQVFWFHYNLGVIYYKSNEFDKAAISFITALQSRPEEALKYILTSEKLYMPIVAGTTENIEDLKQHLEKGYRDAYALLMMSRHHLENHAAAILPGEPVVDEKFNLELF